MKSLRLILTTALIVGVAAFPSVAEEQERKTYSDSSPLLTAAFSGTADSSIEAEPLSPLAMEDTKGKFSSLAATFNGFDWYLGGRRDVLRSISSGGSCLSCGIRKTFTH